MRGLMEFGTEFPSFIVGKFVEFGRDEQTFIAEVRKQYPDINFDESRVFTTFARYLPKGNEDTKMEHGSSGVYIFVDEVPDNVRLGVFRVFAIFKPQPIVLNMYVHDHVNSLTENVWKKCNIVDIDRGNAILVEYEDHRGEKQLRAFPMDSIGNTIRMRGN